ncbi:ABC transporter substrate-binding protein [Selenomonas sp. TAMA-11512]|uniref:ABC transporter substrate-binding protein n=1 Tax=Selenomonas sp. TAMA-11512 TaxID=3095337 RepID=UPI0030882F6B|nr:ABC transporter substrate-binding protein [Selenomonas sp. TAMA-11512]
MIFRKSLKTAALCAVAAMSFGLLAGCGSDNASKGASGEKSYSVGIVQLVEHNALDAANRGFVDALAARGFEEGKNLTIDRQNAQADQSNLQNIGQRFVSNKVSLIYAIATPAAQTVANLTKDIPIVGSAITDYEQAKLVAANNAPGGNVTGTSDMNPIREQIDLLLKIAPETKTIGCIYTSSEINSAIQFNAMKEYAESKGLKVEVATISTVNDIQQAAESLIDKVDAFYEPTDNIIASAMPTLVAVTSGAKKPVIGGEPNQVENGALATYGVDYYELGKQSGNMAADILEGKAKPASMPIEFAKTLKAVVNTTTASKLGITIPEDVLSTAEKVQ